jgi:hypothetical protein
VSAIRSSIIRERPLRQPEPILSPSRANLRDDIAALSPDSESGWPILQFDWPISKLSSPRNGLDSVFASAARRYSVGVWPVDALKARLKGPIDWKPESMAIVRIGTSFCVASTSAALASSIR